MRAYNEKMELFDIEKRKDKAKWYGLND